ncbi:Uu.00g146970.m01.CDS01 [Anthostomella pinea]|uniref:Uu.00g146970.m01.CDS01 n=1 Tax=Anthostomella pinea TaxID=933095 RepID=A0AAI8VRA3_9PEZI|nr:Uu.00g146970.m01.CDS01 [Anthostomella pinea]
MEGTGALRVGHLTPNIAHFERSMGKRSRACEECHRLKIKCDVTTSPTSPAAACERCSRNNLECVPAASRLQRDRIHELEAQVQELRDALQAHQADQPPCRRTIYRQHDLLRLYAHQAGAAWPVIRLPVKLDRVRTESSVLLHSVVVCCFTQETQGTGPDVHDDLVRESMHILGNELIARGQRSLGLVQALLVAAFWNKSTRTCQHGSCYQLVQLAVDMAIDLGIAEPSLQPSPAAYFSRHEDPTSLEARRTWLACVVALSTSSISTRRPPAIPWNAHYEDCLFHLESRGEPSDMLLCQIVRITQLIGEISDHLCLCQFATYVATTTVLMHRLFQAAFPSKTSPCQPLSSPLETALGSIVQNCHAVIATAAEMDPALGLSLPTFCLAPTVLYSLFVLVTALVAATDLSNTYGQCLAKDDFRIEQCGPKLRGLTARLKSLDPTSSCYTTRLLDATGWLNEWYNDYTAILQRYEANLANQKEVKE